jgi:hypothetical protein
MHTSGLQRMPHDFDNQPNFDKENPFRNYTEDQLISYLTQSLRLDSQPGEKPAGKRIIDCIFKLNWRKVEGTFIAGPSEFAVRGKARYLAWRLWTY